MPNRRNLKKRRKYIKNSRKTHKKSNTNVLSKSVYVSSDRPQYILVSGYIRGIESMIKTNVIPDDVVNICHSFYFVNKSKSLLVQYLGYHRERCDEFGIIKIDENVKPGCVSLIKLPHTSRRSESDAVIKRHCFIPNLSTLIPNLSALIPINPYERHMDLIYKQYHGFFSVIQKRPCFLFFESNPDKNCDKELYTRMLSSNKQIPAKKHVSLIYCGKTHGIIYGDHKNLYELKLENVNSHNFNFNEITQNKKNSFANIWYHRWNMHYVNQSDQIFGIQVRKEYSFYWNCSTFDLKSNEWHNIKQFTLKNRKQSNFDCVICNDGPNKLIYVATNFGYVAKYDYNKNHWTKVYSSLTMKPKDHWSKDDRPIMWVKDYQPMILYRAQSTYTTKSNSSNPDTTIINVTYLDMRCNNKDWMLLNKIPLHNDAIPIQFV